MPKVRFNYQSRLAGLGVGVEHLRLPTSCLSKDVREGGKAQLVLSEFDGWMDGWRAKQSVSQSVKITIAMAAF